MSRQATFTWSVVIDVPDNFDAENPADYDVALEAAWQQVQKGDGEITDDQQDPEEDPAKP
jgi:hypothetical protein